MLLDGTASPIQRALDIPAGREGLASLWNRGGYGPIALRMTREFPLTGVGAGSYRILAPDYWRAMANDALPLDNAQNWWRHQIAELGVFGARLIIAFSVLVAWRVTGRERDRRSRSERDVASASTVRGLLIGLGVNVVLRHADAESAGFGLFLSGWWRGSRGGTRSGSPSMKTHAREPRVAWVVAAALAVAYAAGHLLLAAGPLHPAQRAQHASRDYVIGAYPTEPLPEGNEFRWTGREARFIWAAKTRYMAIRFWAHHPDIASRPVHVTMTSPCGLLFDEDLTSDTSMSLGMVLPEGQRTLEATVRVSRTWSPSDAGEPDNRQLGVGIVADFSNDSGLRHQPVTGREAVRLWRWYIISFSTSPEGADSEGRDSPEVPRGRGSLRVRQHVQDALDQTRAAPRNLLRLPSVLHRAAEADRHRRPRRAVHQEVRPADVGAAEDRREGREGRPRPATKKTKTAAGSRQEAPRRPTTA